MFEYQRRRGARWLEVASLAFAAAVFSSTPELEAGVLDLGGDTIVSFRELDGSRVDSDGVADGTLTLEAMALSENARIVIDLPAARFVVAGDVELGDASAIDAGLNAPDLEIRTGGSILLTGGSSIDADGVSGGSVRLCAGADIEIRDRARVSATASALDVGHSTAGGAIHLEAAGRISIASPGAKLRASGGNGGGVDLSSCAQGAGAVTVFGRVEAIGSVGTGGTVAITARQGDVAFGTGLAGIDASGATGSGSVSVTAAGEVTPTDPPSVPAATVTTEQPSEEPCGCMSPPEIPDLVVAAEVDRTTGLTGTVFTFSGRIVESTSRVVDWKWTLTDGRELDGQTIAVTFAEPGAHGALLTATDANGTAVESETAVVVFDLAVQAPPIFGLPDLIGDVDGDGSITLADAHRVVKHAGGLEPLAPDHLSAGDLDLDGQVDAGDALLLGRAVAPSAPLPSALLPDHGAPGTRINLISPALLDPAAVVQVEVGESEWVQTPLRVVRGYATLVVPLDATVRGSLRVVPGPVEVRIVSDGSVVDSLTFEVEAPEPEPADPKAELLAFLDAYVALFSLERDAVAGLLDYAGVDGDEEELLLAAFTGAEQDALENAEHLRALLEAPGGDDLARVFFLFTNAQGYPEYRQRLNHFLDSNRGLVSDFTVSPDGADVDTVLAILCALADASELLSTGGDLLSYGCDALLAAAVVAVVVPLDGPVVDAALLIAWFNGCSVVEATVELALLVNELVGSIEPDLRFSALPTSPGPGESAELRAEIEVTGLDDVCGFVVGHTRAELIEELAETAIERLLTKNVALQGIAKALEMLSEDPLDTLEDRLEKLVSRVVDETALFEMLDELTGKVCDTLRFGPSLLQDLDGILQGPNPNVGSLSFNPDGTASYICPAAGDPTAASVEFIASREICDEVIERTVTVGCELRPVTITMGDNGSLNDDIFEVRMAGQTILTSSVPVRAISTTVTLAVAQHEFQMVGRAAPDGIGTYYITFAGATVVGGDPTTGTDLTPGVVKTFIIQVQP